MDKRTYENTTICLPVWGSYFFMGFRDAFEGFSYATKNYNRYTNVLYWPSLRIFLILYYFFALDDIGFGKKSRSLPAFVWHLKTVFFLKMSENKGYVD